MSVTAPSSAQLGVLYEHPQWFQPLFAALERRGVAYLPIELGEPSASIRRAATCPRRSILSRVAQSSFLREPEHPIFYAAALLDHWQQLRRDGAQRRGDARDRFFEGAPALAHLFARPRDSRDARRAPRGATCSPQPRAWPIRCWSRRTSAARAPGSRATRPPRSCAPRSQPAPSRSSVDKVLLVQDYVPPRGGTILRIETLARPLPLRARGRKRRRQLRPLPRRCLRRAARPHGHPE